MRSFVNPASRYAMVGVAIAKKGADVRVAVTGSGSDGVFRWSAAENKLKADFSAKALEGMGADVAKMVSDIHGSAEYRAHLVGVMAPPRDGGADVVASVIAWGGAAIRDAAVEDWIVALLLAMAAHVVGQPPSFLSPAFPC